MMTRPLVLRALPVCFLTLAGCVYRTTVLHGGEPGAVSILSFGAKCDGQTDDTSAVQRALEGASAAGGRVVVPPGQCRIAGSLRIPPGVALEGALQQPVWSEPLKGSVILATGGRDTEEGPALFEMGSSSAVRGLVVYYPDQHPQEIRPYPWTFHLQGMDTTVENVTLINSYNGIRVGPESNVRHRIRSVAGCVLRRGLLVDACTDIGRVENIQWHCHWWSTKAVGGDWNDVHKFMRENLEAFTFARTDWEYVNNTFVYPAKIGYRFIKATSFGANGHFSGIGADECQICVLVEDIQPMGLLISNGEFVAMHGDRPTEVVIEKTCRGSVRLVDCAFWGPAKQCVLSHGEGFLSLSDCYLTASGRKANPGRALIEADGGRLQVRGCSFGSDEPSIALKKGLQHAIITENNGGAGVEILNEIGDRATVSNNEPPQGTN